jgi:TPR repeat protein
MRNQILFRVPTIISAVVVGGLFASSTFAANGKIDFALAPPAYDGKFVCQPYEATDTIVKKWDSWDGKSLPSGTLENMRVDAKRLASIDPKKYFDSASKILNYLVKLDDEKTSQQAGVDLARLYVDADAVNAKTIIEILPLITRGFAARNATSMMVLGEIYEHGLGVAVDSQKSVNYYKAAAQAGQADALLRLAEMKLAGMDIAMDLDVTLAAKIAFRGMLENKVPDPCFGIKRIARIYSKGTGIIPQNHPLAAAWYQLAADSGDAESAWIVARYHLLGEDVEKDTATLRKYLTLAAERKVAPAMIELGRVYEDGSLFPKDSEMARKWYSAAAEAGVQTGQLRLLSMDAAKNTPQAQMEPVERAIADKSSAPASALTNYARHAISVHGRLDGGKIARPYLERAVALGSTDALVLLAAIDRLQSTNGAASPALVKALENAASRGDAASADALVSHFTCFAPDAPSFQNAARYRDIGINGGNLGALVARELSRGDTLLSDGEQTLRLAMLRSAAMRGVSDGLALLVDAYERGLGANPNDPRLAFWRAKLEADPAALWRYGKLYGDRPDDNVKEVQKAIFVRAAALGDELSTLTLLDIDPTAGGIKPAALSSQSEDQLFKLASKGRGEAIEILARVDGDSATTSFIADKGLISVAMSQGNARFILAVADVQIDARVKVELVKLAKQVTDCDFNSIARLADAEFDIGDNTAATAHVNVLRGLAGENAKDQYRLGRLLERVGSSVSQAAAMAAYQNASMAGHADASRRLLAAYTSPGSKLFDLAKVRSLLPTILKSNDPRKMYNVAQSVLNTQTDATGEVHETIMIEQLFHQSAVLGHVAAMRDYGLSFQTGKFTPKDFGQAVKWLTSASEKGDKVALRSLGKTYLMGLGVEPSLEKSKAMFAKAAALGDKESTRLLASLTALHIPPLVQ